MDALLGAAPMIRLNRSASDRADGNPWRWHAMLDGLVKPATDWLDRYRAVRGTTARLCEPLLPEDYTLQSMPDASPPKWHIAHTTWFYETFLLAPHEPDFKPHNPQFSYLFNSYYESVGARWPRPSRGLLSRPTCLEVLGYRRAVDDRMAELVATLDPATLDEIAPLLELGLHHEQQHQELLLTDLKHAFGLNPLAPAYATTRPAAVAPLTPLGWRETGAGVRMVGHAGDGFAFDNESPRHRVFLESHAVATRLTTNREYLEFLHAGGYDRAEFWLSDGLAARKKQGWTAPLYWHPAGGGFEIFTLHGLRPLDLDEPVCHVSFYEADAFARWAGRRLPTEAEWEAFAVESPARGGNFLDSGALHPVGGTSCLGDVWQWTASPYTPYPGYGAAPGPVGEYNGKFMCNQMILRGGSCATPAGHVRPTYRNFFPPDARWQFTGIRLAEDRPS